MKTHKDQEPTSPFAAPEFYAYYIASEIAVNVNALNGIASEMVYVKNSLDYGSNGEENGENERTAMRLVKGYKNDAAALYEDGENTKSELMKIMEMMKEVANV